MTDTYAQLISISNEIEREKQSCKDSLFSSFASLVLQDNSGEDEKTSMDTGVPSIQHEENMLCLLCLRVKIIGQFIEAGNYEHATQFSEDINIIIENTKRIEREYRLSDEILNHAWCLLMSICPEHEKLLFPYFKNRYKKVLRRPTPFTPNLYFLFTSIAQAYERLGKRDSFIFVLEKLCQLSKERNKRSLHREIIGGVLGLICDKSPEETVRIAHLNHKYFEHSQDAYTGDYYWFYACALQQLGKKSEAAVFFERCYEVRKIVFGRNSWYTAIAKRELSLLVYASSKDTKCQASLLEFIDSIENGLYMEIDNQSLKIVEGKTLYILLAGQMNAPYFENYDEYLRKYEIICDLYDDGNEPLIGIRLAKNLRGAYYFRAGNYILAEEAFLNALNIEDATSKVLTEIQIKSNLLMAYYVQNDLEMAMTVLTDLLPLIEFDESASGLSQKDRYRIYTLLVSIKAQAMYEPEQEEIDEIKAILAESCEIVLSPALKLPACTKELATFIMSAAAYILQNECASRDELCVYLDALDQIAREHLIFPINQLQRAILNHVAALLSWTLNDHRVEKFFSESVRLSAVSDESIVPLLIKVAVFQSYAAYSAKMKRYNTAILYYSEALAYMENTWKSYVRYLNDERLMQILVPTQVRFTSCYAALRHLLDTESLYERALQFKALASLAGRERNRIIHSSTIDADFLRQIRLSQDKLAALETEGMFREITDEYERERAELRQLEAHFASQFPTDNDFMNISWSKLQQVIPDNSVIVEYIYCSLSYNALQFEEDSANIQTGFDVFITQKRDGRCNLLRLTITGGEDILAAVDEFLAILQAESSNTASLSQVERAEDLRVMLYKKLVRPLLPYMDGFETIYISPDYDLVNLPFEILYDEEQEQLDDLYSVIKIECARDFLYQGLSDVPTKGSLIIGNPQYNVEDSDLDDYEEQSEHQDLNRSLRIDPQVVAQLPFSQVEAEQIGKRCASTWYSGCAATKHLLMNASGYTNIHIATHGFYDLSGQSANGMYSSCLLFAGACNWLNTGFVSKKFGNGMITADDVSVNKGFHGMIGAFSAAGVRFVISHLWEANDFSSAVLMDTFYFYYIEKGLSPQLSLKMAKRYLRQVSIGELRQNRWFDYTQQRNTDARTEQLIAQYEKMDDRARPFKSEACWGGYVCYQCC